MSMKFLFAIICVSFVQLAAATIYKDCGSNAATLQSVTVSNCPQGTIPCPFKQGTNVSLSVQLTPTEDCKTLTTSLYGIIAGVKVPFPTTVPDACTSSIKCPVTKGMATTFAISILVDKSYPKLRVVVQVEVKSDDGKSLICIDVPAEIIS